jgi:hypothetical protein
LAEAAAAAGEAESGLVGLVPKWRGAAAVPGKRRREEEEPKEDERDADLDAAAMMMLWDAEAFTRGGSDDSTAAQRRPIRRAMLEV